MIASTPVARWSWDRDNESDDLLSACLRDLLIAHEILSAQFFATDAPTVHITMTEAGKSNSYLLRNEFVFDRRGPEAVALVTDQARAALLPGEIGSVDGSITCSGMAVTGPDGKEAQQEDLFRLSASSFADFVSVDLVTHADLWLKHDLKGRPQPEVYEANSHRLSTLLHSISEALGAETEPGDPTYFAKPTETGAENYFEPDGSPSDVWRKFEVPTRYDIFTHAPGFGRIGYQRTTGGEVRYTPVLDSQGKFIGYLWASESENAASFEPADVGDDSVYRAGLVWLHRLRSAHNRGLSPSQALAELTALPDENGSGQAVPASRPNLMSLAVLRESLPEH
ncbi:hypothetical protein [Streptomyces sp. NPDC004042]|uniref:hypothetical protein n=1 Tax=Streptomyces sp. NPDC004042 TaxID=3154451 RepID=UPI0033BDC391